MLERDNKAKQNGNFAPIHAASILVCPNVVVFAYWPNVNN
jgi:hypothetical protein